MKNGSQTKQQRALTKTRAGLMFIAITAVGFTILLAALEVPLLPVTVKVVASRVGFRLEKDWRIYDLPAEKVRMANAGFIEIPALRDTDGVQSLSLRARARAASSNWSASLASDYLRLHITIPAETQVFVEYHESIVDELRFILNGGLITGTLDTGEELTFHCNVCELESQSDEKVFRQVKMPLHVKPQTREVAFSSDEKSLTISVRVSHESGESILSIGQHLQVRDIGFQQEFAGSTTSAIVGPGRIAYPNMKAKPVELAIGDDLLIRSAKSLLIRRLFLDEAIQVELLGDVTKLKSGPSDALRSRLPSLLEFVYSNQFIQLILGAVMTIGGFVAGALYRMGFLTKK